MKNPNTTSTHEHLLDAIARTLGCSMLSNLQTPGWQAFVRLALPPPDRIRQYDLAEWNEAAGYIFSTDSFDSCETAYTAIAALSRLKCEEIQDCLIAAK